MSGNVTPIKRTHRYYFKDRDKNIHIVETESPNEININAQGLARRRIAKETKITPATVVLTVIK